MSRENTPLSPPCSHFNEADREALLKFIIPEASKCSSPFSYSSSSSFHMGDCYSADVSPPLKGIVPSS